MLHSGCWNSAAESHWSYSIDFFEIRFESDSQIDEFW